MHINGTPAVVVRSDRQLDDVVALRIDHGRITGLYIVRNPHKLERAGVGLFEP